MLAEETHTHTQNGPWKCLVLPFVVFPSLVSKTHDFSTASRSCTLAVSVFTERSSFYFVKGRTYRLMDSERQWWWRNKRCDLAVCASGWGHKFSHRFLEAAFVLFTYLKKKKKKKSRGEDDAYLQHITHVSSCKRICFLLRFCSLFLTCNPGQSTIDRQYI